MGLLKLILYFLVFYYLFKLIMKLLMPFLVKKGMQNMEKKYRQSQGMAHDDSKIGETVIDKRPGQSSKPEKQEGEYIDYEEIE
ncbi:MAG: DUF4834 domain-containing protein [Flavobacteriia bacterium]|nr:MAG: DUF4834 domain-containing protein [Flavobacteriia bacterium]